MTHMTTAPQEHAVDEQGRFTRPYLVWVAAATALSAAWQVVNSLADDRQEIRDSVLTDTIAVVVASLLFAAIAGGLALRALRGPTTRAARTTVGLGVLAVVLAPISWWNAAPMIVAVAVVLLGRATGVDRSGAPRAASVVAKVLVVALLAFLVVANVVERL